MPKPNTLAELSRGQTATVRAVTATGTIRRRLQDIGLVPGAAVVCVGRGMLGGPVACLVRGAVIALRREDAARVAVRV